MIRFRYIALFLFLIHISALKAQRQYPDNYFIPPVDFTLTLSGTFAELRTNHFHSGLDIKTQGEQGKKVFACADGYVSRVKVSAYGFGKALYISHPNGYTTVYAHLRQFSPEIEAWVRSEQYRLQKFEVDLFPQKGMLPVKKGDVVSYSGNSGSSEGPHLHFEIRDSKTEMPVDPQLAGIKIRDFIRPGIAALRIYPEGYNSRINGQNVPLNPELAGWGPAYRLKQSDTLEVAGSYSLGLKVFDLLNGADNKNGIARFEVLIDSVLRFDWDGSTFSFAESRAVNSFIDYPQFRKNGQRFVRTRIDPNNKLSMYKIREGNGIFKIQPGKLQHVKVLIADAHNNESVLQFVLRGTAVSGAPVPQVTERNTFSYMKTNSYRDGDLSITLPGKCLYDDMDFTCERMQAPAGSCSPAYMVGNPDIPLQDYYEIKLRIDSSKVHPGNQLLLASLKPGKKPAAAGGKFENGAVTAQVREFGEYVVMADSTAPVIKPLNISNGKDISAQADIRISISDDFSGIGSYNGYLNGKWILMDYDAKNRLLVYQKDDLLLKGTNNLKIVAEDNCGNTTEYTATIRNK